MRFINEMCKPLATGIHSREEWFMKARLVLLLLVLATLPLLAQSSTPLLEVPYRLFTLANGLTVILHRDASAPVVALNVWYHVGSANERQGRTGFAHLFEHLMFEGSRN